MITYNSRYPQKLNIIVSNIDFHSDSKLMPTRYYLFASQSRIIKYIFPNLKLPLIKFFKFKVLVLGQALK